MTQELQITIIPPTYTTGPMEGSIIRTAEDAGLREITPTEIRANYKRAMLRFNIRSCKWYIEKYAGGRKVFITDVRKRLNDLEQAGKSIERQKKKIAENIQILAGREQRYKKARAKFTELYIYLLATAHDFISRDMIPGTDDYEAKMAAVSRFIGNVIHDLPKNKSGLMSLDAYDATVNKKDINLVWEHYYPRSRAGGEDIFHHCVEILKGKGDYTESDLFTAACSASEVARATKHENDKKLEPHQTREAYVSPAQSYLDGDVPVIRIHDPEPHPFWVRLGLELGKNIPPFAEFPQEMTIEEADKLLTQSAD